MPGETSSSKNLDLFINTNTTKADIYIDNDRITQVFINLINNAIKFTDNGKIEVSIKKSENEIECTVSDTGIGIPHHEIATVFDRFHQVGKAINTSEEGSGLGLSISKGIVDLHYGSIWVESEVGKGSKFIFTLPIFTENQILFENINKGIKKCHSHV